MPIHLKKKFELPPLKLTYDDLNNISTFMINELTNRTPSNQTGTILNSIKVSNEDITFERKDNILLLKEDPLPDISNNLYLIYANKYHF